jgi:hypothetical protein
MRAKSQQHPILSIDSETFRDEFRFDDFIDPIRRKLGEYAIFYKWHSLQKMREPR